eukprot:11507928-Ditylum_brightwellii.AAC.1
MRKIFSHISNPKRTPIDNTTDKSRDLDTDLHQWLDPTDLSMVDLVNIQPHSSQSPLQRNTPQTAPRSLLRGQISSLILPHCKHFPQPQQRT